MTILAQDYDSSTAWNAVLLQLKQTAGAFAVTQALTDFPMLDRVMGLSTDAQGNIYYATGVAEDDVVNATYPGNDEYRSDIVRVIKLNTAGEVVFNIDIDTARHAFDDDAEKVVNPMVAASSRLLVGGNAIGLLHGINTNPDPDIGGTRHQKALSTYLDATTGDITRVSSVWCSHSFDQRLLYDGSGIIENHLGDAYPRQVLFSKNHRGYSLFDIKGELGENNTRTRLGNVALVENDSTYGYIALFSTESTTDTSETISGPRNLAIVRVNKTDSSLDNSLPDILTVSSSGKTVANPLRWLTSYTADSNSHAERPKLIAVGGDIYVVLWEQWNLPSNRSQFAGVYGMVINAEGEKIVQETLITADHHLHRGDDAFAISGKAGWVTGNSTDKSLYIHLVDNELAYQRVTIN